MYPKKIPSFENFLDENLTKSFIRTSSSSTTSPVLFIRKPGGKFRICVNYKTFNAITKKNKYPLPLIQENLNRLTKTKYSTKLNIVVVFNKIKVTENEKWKPVFRIKYGFFENEKWKPLLIIIDKLGKGVILEFYDSVDAETVADIFIRRFYRQHGLPALIISDRGLQFGNILWKRICRTLGIERGFSTVYHPQNDRTTERMNQTMETFLRIYINFDQRNWVKLWFITKSVINNKDAVSTGINFFFSRISREIFKNCRKTIYSWK